MTQAWFVDRAQIAAFADALFRYASPGLAIALRAFREGAPEPVLVRSFVVGQDGAGGLATAASGAAETVEARREATVFCPPIAAFQNEAEPWRARAQDLREAFALSVECDQAPEAARARLEGLLGPATVVVASGGEWTSPETGEVEDKLHLHWRLSEPATGDDLGRLKEARRRAAALVGGDPSNVPMVHPIRWPGTWHRKRVPRLAQIVSLNEGDEVDLTTAADLLEEVVGAPASAASPEPGQARDGGEYEQLVSNILQGENLHDSIARLAAKMVGSGTFPGAAVSMIRGFMNASSAPRDERWSARFNDIPRAVHTASAKFTPPDGPTLPIDEAEAAQQPRAPEQELPPHLLSAPGLVGAIAQWIVDTSRYPQPALAIAAALEIVGTAAGRKYAGPTNSGTHLYVLALAGTGAGKNHAPRVGRRLLQAAGLGEVLGPREFNSASAVWQTMERHPGLLCWMDELGAYLAKLSAPRASGHERTVSAVLRTLWGESFGEVAAPAWADSSGRKPMRSIYAPALSMFGTSVPEELYAALSSADVANGFLNRFLLVSTQLRVEETDPGLDEFKPPKVLADELERIFAADLKTEEHATLHNGRADPPRIVLPWASEDVRQAYKTFRRELDQREEDVRFLTRTGEMAVRIATILAIGRGGQPRAVTMADWMWGRDLALWSAERMMADAAAHMSENDDQRRQKMVMRLIKEAPGSCILRSALTRKIDGRIPARGVKEILETLELGEMIAREMMKPPTGRPGEGYRAL